MIEFQVRLLPEVLERPEGAWAFEIVRDGERVFRGGDCPNEQWAAWEAGVTSDGLFTEAIRQNKSFAVQMLKWSGGKFVEVPR